MVSLVLNDLSFISYVEKFLAVKKSMIVRILFVAYVHIKFNISILVSKFCES